MSNPEKPKYFKGGGYDKYDCYRPGKAHFVHDDYYVSAEQREFHIHTTYMYTERGRGYWAGVNKKLPKVSAAGVMVDSRYVGKSDNE